MQIEISTRHGGLEPDQHAYLQEKAEKLQKYFGRLVAIQVVVDHVKHAWQVGGLGRIKARLRRSRGRALRTRQWIIAHKIENQLRKYKEQVQSHKEMSLTRACPPTPDDSSLPSRDVDCGLRLPRGIPRIKVCAVQGNVPARPTAAVELF